MAAAYASLVSLMHVIRDIEHHHSPPISLDKQLLEPITRHATFFQEFLHAYSPPPVADGDEEAADPLEMRIAGAAYAVEDAIESHVVDAIQQLRSHNANDDEKIGSFNLCRDRLQSAIVEMDSIKKMIDNEKKKKELVVVEDQVAMTKVLASAAHNKTMVGSDDVLLEIMEKLAGGKLDYQVIPIVGMGGIGKTFLARNIYTQPLIKEHFDICAWATISQHYNTAEILCEVLSQATNMNMEQLSEKSVDVFGSEIHKYLFGRRFLIVMDDIWSIDAWDKIQRFFPNNNNGSRVLVTTRLSQLSSQLNNDYSLHMSFLDEASSWDLFSKTVFGDKSCPPELKNIGEKIVGNCRGLPLSIAVVGGLLKKLDDTRASWESIRDNLTSVVNMQNDKHCLRLLKMSYNHLPVYLKPCFLYMGVFEEDDEIYVSTLVKLWVSEGFLKPTSGEALETTARRYLQDLVDRNLILISGELGCTGSIKYCKIHDLLRDLCLKEGHKDGFYHVIGQCNPPPQGLNTQRRVVIPKNTSKEKVCDDLRSMLHARSIICEYGMVPPFRDLGLLRTLHAYKANLFDVKNYVNSFTFDHVNLRHLAIEARDMSSFIPSVNLLWNLHTFIVCGPLRFCGSTLLADFWKMPQFRHIKLVDDCLCLPDPPSNVGDGVAEVILENLQMLSGVSNLKFCEAVVKRIPNIKKLRLIYNDDEDEYLVGNIQYLCRLESLSVTICFKPGGSRPYNMHNLTFPRSLKKLSLYMYSAFEWEDDMLEKIGGSLPLLEKLKLWYGCFDKGKWETVEGQFPCLKYLELHWCQGLENWTAAEEGSNILARLEHLRLFSMQQLEKIPCELGNISTLKIIQLIECGEGAVKSAKEMVDEQVELQGGKDQLSFRVVTLLMRGSEHLLSLAGPNFEVIGRAL